jgi:hypothetical protein
VLKKAGIVVATAAAGLLAVSPLAFAGDDHGKTKKIEDVNHIDGSTHGGLLNVGGNNISVPVNVCDNQVPVNVLGIQVPLNDTNVLAQLTGAVGLLSSDTDAESDGDNTIDDSCTAEAESGDSAEIDD